MKIPLKKSLTYPVDWLKNRSRTSKPDSLPRHLNFLVTDNCNSKCVMCDIWKTKSENELTADQFHDALKNPLFQELRAVGISGGEPTLRKDFPDVVESIIKALPKLKGISVTSHGFHTKKWEKFLPILKEMCAKNDIDFMVNISIDGVGGTHNKIRGLSSAFKTATKTIDNISSSGVRVQVQTTLTEPNVYGAPRVLQWAKKRDLDVIFRKGTEISRLGNEESVSKVGCSGHADSFLADFMSSPVLHGITNSPARILFYKDLSKRLVTGATRSAPCNYQNDGLLMTAHGDLYHCSLSSKCIGNAHEEDAHKIFFSENSMQIRRDMITNICPGCVHDQTGPWSPPALASTMLSQKSFVKRLKWGGKAVNVVSKLSYLITRAKFSKPIELNDAIDRNKKALIIGAYGGEHVGDAAILGGVMYRLNSDRSVDEAVVLSTRTDRTQRWVDTIISPVDINVIDYENDDIEEHLKKVDMLVLAGGPLMDIPMSLINYLTVILMANKLNIPFIVEGIGCGPFKNAITQSAAKSILRLASNVIVRSEGDSKHEVLGDRKRNWKQDPAFDYLETRGKELSLDFKQAVGITKLLENSEGKKVIGINLRPMWGKYATKGYSIEDMTNKFLQELSRGLIKLNEDHDGKLLVISFPMNPDTFGFSDTQIAQELDELLPDSVEHRIWEAEPGIDEVVSLLRKLDMVVAMRFHACIFSLSQGIPTLGIDYSLGREGKVGKLFKERGQKGNMKEMESFTAEWLKSKCGEVFN